MPKTDKLKMQLDTTNIHTVSQVTAHKRKTKNNRTQYPKVSTQPLKTKFADSLPGGAGRPKFHQLEMVTTFTYRPSLVKIDARSFELSW